MIPSDVTWKMSTTFLEVWVRNKYLKNFIIKSTTSRAIDANRSMERFSQVFQKSTDQQNPKVYCQSKPQTYAVYQRNNLSHGILYSV